MLKKILLLATAVFTLPTLTQAAEEESDKTMEFAHYQCRLTLPSDKFEWFEHEAIPKAVGALGDDTGACPLRNAMSWRRTLPRSILLEHRRSRRRPPESAGD